jgi:hypothetical protein
MFLNKKYRGYIKFKFKINDNKKMINNYFCKLLN